VRYGDTVTVSYDEKNTIPGVETGLRSVTARVLMGADGDVSLFSKRFKDGETAARVQFRRAECLFELAKEYRKLQNQDMAADAIARGRLILEEAMQDHPNTSLVTEGEYLLANLYQELASEELAAENEKQAIKLYQQAVSKFSAIISTWPDSPYAARAQFHKAMCLEKLGDDRASTEEYVRLCYAYPDSPLVADATIRLATHFYKQGKYDVSGRIYEAFAKKYSSHERAPKVLFMSAMSRMKQAEAWSAEDFEGDERLLGREVDDAVAQENLAGAKLLDKLIEEMKQQATTDLCAQSLYWSGIAYRRAEELPTAYLRLKRLTFEYPETKWARMARGLLYTDERLQRAGED
jgi:outer membrane protein assembly factor BamD (BamD/ComL family)